MILKFFRFNLEIPVKVNKISHMLHVCSIYTYIKFENERRRTENNMRTKVFLVSNLNE